MLKLKTEHGALLAAFVAVGLWAFAFPASKAVLTHFTVEEVVLLRYLVACGFYLGLYALGLFRLPRWQDWPALIGLGVLGVTVYQLGFVFGLSRVTAGAAAMVVAASPMVSSILAWVFLGERLSWLAWLGSGISLVGVALIVLVKGAGGEVLGYLMMLVATVSISVFFVCQKPFFRRYSPLGMTSYTSFFGCLTLLYWLPGAVAASGEAPWAALLSIAAMGVLSSGVGFLLWFYALSRLPTGIVTSFLFLQPVMVTLLAWLWLGELPNLQTFIGGGVVLLGVGLILKQQIFGRGG